MKQSIQLGRGRTSMVQAGPGANPANIVAGLMRNLTAKMGTYKSQDLRLTEEEAGALGIPADKPGPKPAKGKVTHGLGKGEDRR